MSGDADVAIVGGGPAGLAAAIELRRRGVGRVVVLERERDAGGIPRHTQHLGFGLRDLRRMLSGPAYAARYADGARAAGVDVRTETSVTGWSDARTLVTTSPRGRETLTANAVLLATGCRERPRAARLVPGSRPQGVLTTGALQQLVYLERQRVGCRAVVVGAEHVSFSAVTTLGHGGATTVAIVTEYPTHQSHPLLVLATAGWRGVPVLTGTSVTAIRGRRRVEAVDLTDAASGRRRELACDTVVFTGDWIPEYDLARSGAIVVDATRGPRVDGALRTSVRGVFAAGNVVHAAEAADVAALSGRHAAAAIEDFLRSGAWPAAPVPIVCEAPLRWISPGAITSRDAPPRGRFVLRSAEAVPRGALVVRQGTRELWRERPRGLVPGRSTRLVATWTSDVDRDGPPIIVSVADPSGRARR